MYCPSYGHYRFPACAVYAPFPVGCMGGVLVGLQTLSLSEVENLVGVEIRYMDQYEAHFDPVDGLRRFDDDFSLLL
jgi:hypothetical protein